MIKRRHVLGLLAGSLIPVRSFAAYQDSDYFKTVKGPEPLPPVEERLPKVPRVVKLNEGGKAAGRHGGTVRMLIGGQRDIRYMPINSYARLVGYDEHLQLQPDLVESYEVSQDRIFTFHLREGHRWSDGSEFTADDFRYVWDDMFHNKKLYKGGVPAGLKVNDKPPRFQVLDRLTIRYSWDDPNPDFMADIASPSPVRLMHPAAYLKQFHANYQDKDKLASLIKEQGVEDWVALHQKMSRTVRPENPDLPTLDAWRPRTAPPAGRFVFERNPYYHRVDENGLQLPYIDRILMDVSSSDLIAAKTGTGESELQFSNLDFADYTFLKNAEQRYPLTVDLWKRIQGTRVCLMPNLNCKDEVWRKLWWDVRVRRALSLAINRREINKAAFFGLARESSNTILPESPLFKAEYREAWSAYDPALASKLLDEAGLDRRGSSGERLLPDGRSARIIIETAGENTVESDVLELIRDHWYEVGIKIFVRVSQRELLRRRVKGGETIMTVAQGLDNGVPTADMSPKELAPTSDDQMHWPLWGLYHQSANNDGHPPELPEALMLYKLFSNWRAAGDHETRERIWHEMLNLYTDQVFTIGTVNATLQPVVHSSRLRNIPKDGLYGFDPMSYLGVYMPDTFWYDDHA